MSNKNASDIHKFQVVAALVAKSLYSIIYNLYFHPLRKFPGPRLAAATPIPFARCMLNGRMVQWTSSLHEKYGEIVRVHPDELSFIGSTAWQDIYNCRPELPKPELGTIRTPNGVRPMMITSTEDHTRQRRILSHAFSDRALRDQEHLLHKYTDLLVSRLHDHINAGKATLDINQWYQFATFDIIGDLCFGESFDCLEGAENHPWVVAAYRGIKIGKLLLVFQHFPPMESIIRWALPNSVKEKRNESFNWTKEKITKRINLEKDRPDFMKYILENNHKQGMTRAEIDSTVTGLILAGSGETTALAMAAVTYFALKTPGVMERLRGEIQDVMRENPKGFTVANLQRLPYLHAVILEAIRMHPPAPLSSPREINRPIEICGVSVPIGYRVNIPPKTANKFASKWIDADKFLPERWLANADARYANDDKAIFEPFAIGPRNCIGKSLAWAEIKLILAKVLWDFDFQLAEEKNVREWTDQKVFFGHEKLPLYVKLSKRT